MSDLVLTLSPEERYILAVLAEDPHRRLRTFYEPRRRRDGYWLCGAGRSDQAYAVERSTVLALLAAGYVAYDPAAGGCPEITPAGRRAVEAPR